MSKTALVTGMETSVIAKSVAVSLLESGYALVATSEGRYDPGTEERTRFDTESAGFPAVSFESVDFSSEESVSDLVVRLSTREYDVVVNCAAILATEPGGKLRNESSSFNYAEFDRVLRYNVTSVAAICLGLRNHIRSGGVIINVTSSAATEGAFATLSYNASKAAVNNLTKSLANVLGPSRGIRVNSIAPGWIPPSADVADDGVVALANALTPSLVAGKPADVVAAVQYVIDNSFQNGAILDVDGGITSSYLPYLVEYLQMRGLASDEEVKSLVSLIREAKGELGRAGTEDG